MIFIAPEDGKLGWNAKSPLPSGNVLVIVPSTLVAQWESEAMRFLKNNLWNIIVYPSKRANIGTFWNKVWASKMEDDSMFTILICSYAVCIQPVLTGPDSLSDM